MTFIIFTFLLVSARFLGNRTPGKPNTVCVLTKCGGKAIGCQQDKLCNKVIECTNACPDFDTACSTICVTRFGTTKFDDLTVCLLKNNCIDPYPKVDFPVPQVLSSLALENFQGVWYTIAGLDKGQDCFDYQVVKITKEPSGRYKRDLVINFPEGPRQIITTLTEKEKGRYTLDYTLGGGGTDEWYILSSSNNLIVAIYIGRNLVNDYRGGYVLRSTPGPLTDSEIGSVKLALQASQSKIGFEEFTILKN